MASDCVPHRHDRLETVRHLQVVEHAFQSSLLLMKTLASASCCELEVRCAQIWPGKSTQALRTMSATRWPQGSAVPAVYAKRSPTKIGFVSFSDTSSPTYCVMAAPSGMTVLRRVGSIRFAPSHPSSARAITSMFGNLRSSGQYSSLSRR